MSQVLEAQPRTPMIDGERLWRRIMTMAEVGATGRGGVDRQTLTQADTRGRQLFLDWVAERGYEASMDAVGNLFVRRPGTDPDLAPVMTGSHLDTQPTGGNFDGVYGVLAGLEVMETLDDHGVATARPIDLVVWLNEEGTRFPPTTMGSAVYAGALELASVLQTRDAAGVSVEQALAEQIDALPKLAGHALGEPAYAYIENHIEQGPVLENEGLSVGIVNGIQGLRQLSVSIQGQEAHAGTTPPSARRDALLTATHMIQSFGALVSERGDDRVRLTVGRLNVYPNAPNTIPAYVNFTVDLRHPEDEILAGLNERVQAICDAQQSPCTINAEEVFRSPGVSFDANVLAALQRACEGQGIAGREMMSGATHDAKFMARLGPAAMIFVPCENGLSHNEAENADAVDLAAGTRVLAQALHELAVRRGPLND